MAEFDVDLPLCNTQQSYSPPGEGETFAASWECRVTELAGQFLFPIARGKAVEGRRSPRRKAFAGGVRTARSVLDCASP
jgi:hypothetical protein